MSRSTVRASFKPNEVEYVDQGMRVWVDVDVSDVQVKVTTKHARTRVKGDGGKDYVLVPLIVLGGVARSRVQMSGGGCMPYRSASLLKVRSV